MYLLRVQVLLRSKGPLENHEWHVNQKQLDVWKPGMFCIFASHQWGSFEDADPSGVQVGTLRSALAGLIADRYAFDVLVLLILSAGGKFHTVPGQNGAARKDDKLNSLGNIVNDLNRGRPSVWAGNIETLFGQ